MNGSSTASKSRDPPPTPSRPDDRPLPSNQVHDVAPAICRICRYEGTPSEPLFYPCKCSGSIKYVHQDCLMEWLSHSQKKYCELCKTSFRFTKLYSPDMPQSLPVHVFLEHMTKYVLRNAMLWLRAGVAINVWICWLPYFMRSVWSFMFWVSDEGLVGSSVLAGVTGTAERLGSLSSSVPGSEVCPASPLLAPTSTPSHTAEAIMGGLGSQNVTDFLIRFLLSSLGIPSSVVWPDSPASNGADCGTGSQKSDGPVFTSGTLLSDVSFIRNLTGNSALHRSVVSVLEGQLITILVILSFILVILVRDYVIQQQPDLNMRAAFAVPEEALADQPVQAAVGPDDAPDLRGPDESDSDDETLDDGLRDEYASQGVASDNPRLLNDAMRQESGSGTSPATADAEVPTTTPSSEARLNEDYVNRSNVVDFSRVYRQAEGDPEEIQRIAEEEGLQDRLEFYLDVTRRSQRNNPTDRASERRHTSTFSRAKWLESNGEGSASAEVDKLGHASEVEHGDSPSDSALAKGKERVWPLADSINTPNESHLQFSRHRSASDGPLLQGGVNPLSSNNWSFSGSAADASSTGVEISSNGANGVSARAKVSQDPSIDTSGPSGLHEALTSEEANSTARSGHEVADENLSHSTIETSTEEVQNVPAEAVPQRLVDRLTNFMWGDLEPEIDDHAPIVVGHADEDLDDQWVDVPMGDDLDNNEDGEGEDADGEQGGAGLDAEAMDDLDDFDGIMELIGMRGPVAGLFQNAIFCSVLVSVTIFACIFVPYNIGRVSVWVLANPIMVVRMLFEMSKLVQDGVIVLGSAASWGVLALMDSSLAVFGTPTGSRFSGAKAASIGLYKSSGSRVLDFILKDFPTSASEMQNFSAISHEALITVKGHFSVAVATVSGVLGAPPESSSDYYSMAALASMLQAVFQKTITLPSLLANPSSWVIDLGEPQTPTPVNPELAYWPSLDRFWAILAGYITIFCMGALYLKRGTPFSRGSFLQAWEVGVIDTLHQASGIIKVILIISIEMLVFPLYCGLLLDVALLPIFENATLTSRLMFTYTHPLTSIFVHWFVGTGYMFHFALFVSMCRKIMRPGVLYFIRDPDDPEFHPVRDVLERNLTTQLRKILFSAFVYGALVIVCLGGIVWGLAFAMPGVLPIHYSSNEPVLEFPVDLLFYNFLMPLAVKVFKPSDGLHTMYTWWFRKLARSLRLTYFLFGERRIDEEGTLRLASNSPHRNDLPYRRLWLELDEKKNQIAPKTWRDIFEGGDAKPNPQISGQRMRSMRRRKTDLVDSGQLIRSGRFVRAPASDRVKIPKGKKVFLTVTERDYRRDDRPDDDLYASNQYQVVYIPPHFGVRIFLFILFIWVFAAVTGVGFTIVPLVVGRRMFKVLIPEHIKTNDIYAFSIGVHILGSIAYLLLHIRGILAKVPRWWDQAREEVLGRDAKGRLAAGSIRGAKLFYAYFFLCLVFPLVISTLMEVYLTIPLHTYMHPPKALSPQSASDQEATDPSRHNIGIIQAWTLGVLYLKLGAKMITTLFRESRLATAVRTVLRRGWARPNIGILTRAFVVPGLAISAVAIFGPPTVTALLLRNGVFASVQPVVDEAAEAARIAVIYRNSYPVAVFALLVLRHAVSLIRIFNGWTARIRDEAYLIGERLHNFGAGPTSAKKARGAWRAGGPRL